MLESLENKIEFKLRNLNSWKKNSEFWLSSELRQITDTKKFLVEKLPLLFSSEIEVIPNIVDMGTGNGWLLELLIELNIQNNFVGLDFNEVFIDFLRNKFSSLPNVSFYNVDLEAEVSPELYNKADFVFNFFNFFELADLEKAFQNACAMLKPGGKLVILTIDSFYLMIALSKSLEDLKNILGEYERAKERKEVPFFFQKIDLGNSESENYEYASVLYSFNDFFQQAKNNKLNLIDFSEIVKTSKFIPKVYHYFVFQK